MSTAAHTPGPWSIVPAPAGDDINIAARHPDGRGEHLHPNGFAVACAWALWDRDGGEDTQIANARLIAAAPDLLAALQDVLRTNERWGLTSRRKAAYNAAIDAIRKATVADPQTERKE